MSENKKMQTLAQRFGFSDKDLKTPLHDQIMLWLDKKAEAIVAACPQLVEYRRKRWPAVMGEKLEISSKIWEKPVVTGNGYIVGFADMWINLAVPVELTDKGVLYRSSSYVLVEVKTTIPSLGELFRQMNMYRQYVSSYSPDNVPTVFAIVSPDDRFAEQIESQGFYFVKYVPEQAQGSLW